MAKPIRITYPPVMNGKSNITRNMGLQLQSKVARIGRLGRAIEPPPIS
ncbi:hypothetical protein [Rhodanobacter sp. C03]|nr:hypothetical protein [Rhodanobacter sp. C03]